MNNTLKTTQKRFATVILILVLAITSLTWGILELVNETSIGRTVDTAELHAHTSKSGELHEYILSQEPYEAHFIALSNSIREQDQKRLTAALGVTALGVSVTGVILAIFISKILMKPIEDAHRSQERFLQDAAHELRNPLAALSIALQQAKHKNGIGKELLHTFERQTKRLVSINEDLLFLERKGQSHVEQSDLSALLNDCIEELQPIAYKKNIKIVADIEESVTKTLAPSDFIKVAKNLIDNAIKYSSNRSKVQVHLQKSKGKIILTITDKGIGIPVTEIATVGERFFRASNVGTTDGTGLGIAIVKKILNSYGGEIKFFSDKEGTTVTVLLPA